jgi:hypothetical protein
MASKVNWQTIGWFIAGAIFLEYILKKASSPSAGGFDSNIFGSFSSGITNFVGTLTGNKQKDFVIKMTPIADQIHAATGIDPLITMTQAALESGWGSSGLTRKANNLYGFTGDTALLSWLVQKGMPQNTPMDTILNMDTSAAPFILMKTHESATQHSQYFTRPGDIVSQDQAADRTYDLLVWRPFRRYDSWLASVQDWAHLISTALRYDQAYADARAGDSDAYFQDVASAGYATEPDYATQLASVAGQIQGIQTA